MSVETDLPFRGRQFCSRASQIVPQRSIATQPRVDQTAQNLSSRLVRLGAVFVPHSSLPRDFMGNDARQLIHGGELRLTGSLTRF